MRRLISFIFFFVCCLPASGMSVPLSGAFGDSTIIDISSLRPFLETLPPDEKDEQLRDWALYGVRSVLALTSTGEMPIRHPALKDAIRGEISPGRVFSLTSTEWGVVVAPELIRNKPLLGRLIDGAYASCNCLPEIISLFTYSADRSFETISIAFAGSINAKDLYTPEYGYYSATVSSLKDFSNFAAKIDDLVSFHWRSGSILIGGRKYAKDSRRSLTVEEIATLYQAYNAPAATGSAARKLRGQPQPAEANIGFSLDQMLHYEEFGEDIKSIKQMQVLAKHTVDPAFAALLTRHDSDFITVGNRLKNKHDIRPFLALLRRYEKSHIAAEERFSDLLQFLKDKNSYQAARYDGKLQGTSLGMILFYTDLQAKLWTLDYGGSAPSSVRGFRKMLEIKVPKLYWNDLLRLSKTRLWFGLRQEGFELYGDKVLFQPVATRVYAASSDPSLPGKESSPNYTSSEFLGWWDSHYEAMAAAEPYYHKLDQIQKWSCIFMVLKEKKSHLLDFLMGVPIRHDLDFETWNKNETTITKIKIPFLDRHRYGCTAECLPLLSSKPYSMMGGNYKLSGGVSLASRKDILAKMRRQDSRGHRKSALLPEDHLADAGAGSKAGSASRKSSGHKTPADSGMSRAQGVNSGKRPLILNTEPARSTGRGPASVADRKYGTFSAEKNQDAIRLKWTKGPSLAPYELVAALAALQEANKHSLKGEEIFSGLVDIQSVVRVKKWNLYLVKTAASRDEWIYLAVNPEKADEYQAKTAAAFLEADIFCARLISDSNARKLAAGKPVVK